jgi:hypothetical protein
MMETKTLKSMADSERTGGMDTVTYGTSFKGMGERYREEASATMPPIFPPGFGDMVRKACRTMTDFLTTYFERVWAMDKFAKVVEAEGGPEAFWRNQYPERAFLLKGLRRSQRERLLAKELTGYFSTHWEDYRRVE